MSSPVWQTDLSSVIDKWASSSKNRAVVISPDVDGLTSAAILNEFYPLTIIGIYTTTHLLMLDDFDSNDAKNALWLDHDVSQKGIKCIGQHLVHQASPDRDHQGTKH
jgi:hypothetical protein